MALILNLKRFGQLYLIVALFGCMLYYYAAYNSLIATYATLNAYVEVQDNAIERLNALNAEQAKKQKEADKAADKIREADKKEIARLDSLKIPDQCEDAVNLGIKEAKKI